MSPSDPDKKKLSNKIFIEEKKDEVLRRAIEGDPSSRIDRHSTDVAYIECKQE